MRRLDNSDLVLLELGARYYMDKPVDREAVTAVIDEVNAWRALGESPEAVAETIESLRYDLDMARDEINEWARAEAASKRTA